MTVPFKVDTTLKWKGKEKETVEWNYAKRLDCKFSARVQNNVLAPCELKNVYNRSKTVAVLDILIELPNLYMELLKKKS